MSQHSSSSGGNGSHSGRRSSTAAKVESILAFLDKVQTTNSSSSEEYHGHEHQRLTPPHSPLSSPSKASTTSSPFANLQQRGASPGGQDARSSSSSSSAGGRRRRRGEGVQQQLHREERQNNDDHSLSYSMSTSQTNGSRGGGKSASGTSTVGILEHNSTSGTRSNVSIEKHRPRRKWVWDDWDDDEVVAASSAVGEAQHQQPPPTWGRDDRDKGDAMVEEQLRQYNSQRAPSSDGDYHQRGRSQQQQQQQQQQEEEEEEGDDSRSYFGGGGEGPPRPNDGSGAPRGGRDPYGDGDVSVVSSVTAATYSVVAAEDIAAKISSMKAELRGRKDEVIELKTALARLRASNARRRERLAAKWAAKQEQVKEQRKSAIDRQRKFTAEVEADVEALSKRSDELERQVLKLRTGRQRDLDLSRLKCAKELKKAREAWAATERSKLERLASQKMGAIKQGAIKALEPELAMLVSDNRKALAQAKEQGREEMKQLALALEREVENHVNAETIKIQAEMDAQVAAAKREIAHAQRLTTREAESRAAEVRDQSRRAMEQERVRFEADRKRLREAGCSRLAGAREEGLQQAAEADRECEEELALLKARGEAEVEDRKELRAEQLEALRREVTAELQEESLRRQKELKAATKAKSDGEADMVNKRLRDEAAEHLQAMQADRDKEVEEVKQTLRASLQAAVEEERAARQRYHDDRDAQAQLEGDVKELEQRIASAEGEERELRAMLQGLTDTAAQEREQHRQRLAKLEEELEQERKDARTQMAALQQRAESSDDALVQVVAEQAKEQERVRAEQRDEVEAIEMKIDAVIQRKREQLQSLSAQLTAAQTENALRDQELEEARKKTFS